jgi:hypothetical protein
MRERKVYPKDVGAMRSARMREPHPYLTTPPASTGAVPAP